MTKLFRLLWPDVFGVVWSSATVNKKYFIMKTPSCDVSEASCIIATCLTFVATQTTWKLAIYAHALMEHVAAN